MAQTVDTRTVHTVYIDLEDNVLSKFESGDEVEVVLRSRFGTTAAKKLTVRDVDSLTIDFSEQFRTPPTKARIQNFK